MLETLTSTKSLGKLPTILSTLQMIVTSCTFARQVPDTLSKKVGLGATY